MEPIEQQAELDRLHQVASKKANEWHWISVADPAYECAKEAYTKANADFWRFYNDNSK